MLPAAPPPLRIPGHTPALFGIVRTECKHVDASGSRFQHAAGRTDRPPTPGRLPPRRGADRPPTGTRRRCTRRRGRGAAVRPDADLARPKLIETARTFVSEARRLGLDAPPTTVVPRSLGHAGRVGDRWKHIGLDRTGDPGIVLRLHTGRMFAVTVDAPEQGAAQLNVLIARSVTTYASRTRSTNNSCTRRSPVTSG